LPIQDGIVRVIQSSIPRLTLLLNEKYFLENQVQQVLFGAQRSCPACTHANRAVGRHSARLARQYFPLEDKAESTRHNDLCVGHFQLFAAELSTERRMTGMTHYANELNHAAKAMTILLRSAREADSWPIEGTAKALDRGLTLLAGRPNSESLPTETGIAKALELYPSLVESISCPDTCPLCIETERARQRWLLNVQKAAGFEQDAWLFFPTCPEHVCAVARLDEPRLTAAVVERGLSASHRFLRQQIQVLVRAAALREEEDQIKAQGPEFWAAYKRKRARRDSPVVKTPSLRLGKCPGCERIEIIADYAANSLLDLLNRKENRKAFSQGYGLCLKHFARVYLMTRKGVVRSMLSEDELGRFSEFTRNIANLDRDSPKSEMASLRNSLVKQTLQRFCGFS
jgi:hypothetical protein